MKLIVWFVKLKDMLMTIKNKKKKIEAKNHLEGFAYNLRNTIKEEQLAAKLDESDKQKLNEAIDSTLRWVESNPNAEKEDYDAKQKQIEEIVQPIMTKLYQGDGGGGMPGIGGMGGMPGGFPGGGMPGGFPVGFPQGGFPQGGGFGGGNTPGGNGPTVDEVD